MRRSATSSSLLLSLVLLVPVAACGGDDDGDVAASSTTSTTETETDTETETETQTERRTERESGTETERRTERESEGAAQPGDTTADAYATDVCGAVGGWYEQINTASEALVDDAVGLTDEEPSAGKELVLAFLDDAVGFTDDLIVDLEAAGVPDTESGAETAERLVTGIGDVRTLFSDARDDTAALPADDPEAIATGLEQIGSALSESATAVGANFQEVLGSTEDPELAGAFEAAAPCQELAAVS